MVSSYVGENGEFERQYLAGELEVEFARRARWPSGSRAGGAGNPGVLHARRLRHVVAEGKETREFDGRMYVMERGYRGDFSLVAAWKGDRRQPRLSARPRATSIRWRDGGQDLHREVEELVEPGRLDPDHVHTPGIFVHAHRR